MDAGTGLMAFWAKIEPSYLDRFRSWHNAEHMPERVSIPGFRAGQRYLGNGSRDFFLMMYETQDPAVLGSEDYLARLNAPTPWTRESLPNFREPARNIYRLLEAQGAADLFRFPCMVSVRFNCASAPAGLVGRISGLAGAGRTRFFGIDSEISGIQTSERKIYGGGPGAQRWLLLAECSLDAVADASALRAAIALEAGAWQDLFVDAFTIDYVLARAAD